VIRNVRAIKAQNGQLQETLDTITALLSSQNSVLESAEDNQFNGVVPAQHLDVVKILEEMCQEKIVRDKLVCYKLSHLRFSKIVSVRLSCFHVEEALMFLNVFEEYSQNY
jgi:hypothetical protein